MNSYFSWKIATLFCGLLAVSANVVSAQAIRSVYSSLSEKQCREVKKSRAVPGDYEARCPGIAGYKLILTEGDLRQNIQVVTPTGKSHSLDLWQVISGGFSTVGAKAEWRLKANEPVALIVRFNASEDSEHPNKITSYLAVAKITSQDICVTAKIPHGPNTNVAARKAADEAASKPCLATKE